MKYEYDFENLYLPKNEYKLLKQASRHKYVPYSEKYNNLIDIKMINYTSFSSNEIGVQYPIKNKCQITEKGLCYLQYYAKYYVDNRTPIIISIVALLISLVNLIISA